MPLSISHFDPQTLPFSWPTIRPDSSGPEIFWSLFKNQTKKRTLKASFFSWKPLETESLAEAQFVIDSFRLFSQSNNLNYSSNDCDRLILACFIREQMHAGATLTRLENKVWFENSAE